MQEEIAAGWFCRCVTLSQDRFLSRGERPLPTGWRPPHGPAAATPSVAVGAGVKKRFQQLARPPRRASLRLATDGSPALFMHQRQALSSWSG
ncbi:hypothetical protein KL86PLE_100423 [uncultured Pleomorphomonas sp.]|uniref:Uncharacterized protein n=1 Tax=uncultured Pleomorphomonas sp. TaxID=442121 RepID=A0A212L369_9HYPH|nr:hypothetical protein KL86PLE_100423 [uncultured Pleomorphomonas sp.]